jgi:hypothetical protein
MVSIMTVQISGVLLRKCILLFAPEDYIAALPSQYNNSAQGTQEIDHRPVQAIASLKLDTICGISAHIQKNLSLFPVGSLEP